MKATFIILTTLLLLGSVVHVEEYVRLVGAVVLRQQCVFNRESFSQKCCGASMNISY